MSRISGTVSRAVPLDAVIGRSLTLSGTFDLYVSQAELALIDDTLDMLMASGILTKHVRYFESDSLIAGAVAPVVDVPASGTATPSQLQIIPHAIPDAVTQTYTYTAAKTMEIVDVIVHKVGVGTGNSIKVQDNAAADISDAIAAAVDKAKTLAGTIDRTKNVVNAGSTYKILATKAAGSMACEVYLVVIFR